MDRLALGTAGNGRFVRDVLGLGPSGPEPRLSSPPAASGSRSERVLSLVLALAALRAEPEISDDRIAPTNG